MKQKKHISLSVTERCNLNCIYCFETSKSSKRISYETALAVIDKELNCRDEYDLVNIDFMGGEPFLELERPRITQDAARLLTQIACKKMGKTTLRHWLLAARPKTLTAACSEISSPYTLPNLIIK